MLAPLEASVPAPEGHTAWAILQQIVAFGIALATLYGLVIRPAGKRIAAHFRETITEVVAAQQQTNATLQRVDHQLHPNGGASAHDYARKAYEAAEATRAEQRHQSQRLDHMQGELTAQGWRQQESNEALVAHIAESRAATTVLREALELQGIGLPALIPNDPATRRTL